MVFLRILSLGLVMIACVDTRASMFDGKDGTSCAVCTALVLLTEQLAEVHNHTVAKELEVVCDLFPKGPVREGCDALIVLVGPYV